MNKEMSDIEANHTISQCIQQIANKRLLNKRGHVREAALVTGYVAQIHDNEGDDLYGTIDVQEYIPGLTEEDKANGVGYHRGVRLSAIQNNMEGQYVIPSLMSEVIIRQDPETLYEYVADMSHAQTIQVQAHDTATIGVVETEKYSKESDYDFDELPKTGRFAMTGYSADKAVTTAKNTDDEDGSELTVDGNKIQVKHADATLIADAQKLRAAFDAEEIVINSDGVFLGKANSTEPAVLGNQLADLMAEWLDALVQVKVATQAGPQPFINLATFIKLQTKVKQFKASTSGFLSKHVKVQSN